MANGNKDRDLPGRPVALVTGGTRGIGFAIAQSLGESGWDLAVNGVRNREQVADILSELEETGASVAYCRGDLGSSDGRDEILEAMDSAYDRVDLLVNNAGVAPKERLDILEANEESFERLMRINLQGPYFLTQAIARRMINRLQAASKAGNADNAHERTSSKTGANPNGCIINIGSISATVVSVMRGEYCISKAGFAMHSRLWAVRLAEFGIPVYEVRPGVIQTDMTAGVKEKYDRMFKEGLTIQPRWGMPRDVARAVRSLASSDFSYSSGEVFMVDGGLTVTRL